MKLMQIYKNFSAKFDVIPSNATIEDAPAIAQKICKYFKNGAYLGIGFSCALFLFYFLIAGNDLKYYVITGALIMACIIFFITFRMIFFRSHLTKEQESILYVPRNYKKTTYETNLETISKIIDDNNINTIVSANFFYRNIIHFWCLACATITYSAIIMVLAYFKILGK